MKCTCDAGILLAGNLDRIDTELAKIEKAIQDGLYDPRSIVGDAHLRMKAFSQQMREMLPTLPPLR